VTSPNAGSDAGQASDDLAGAARAGEEPRVVVRDRRRIDPDTGQVRPPTTDQPEGASGRHAAVDTEVTLGEQFDAEVGVQWQEMQNQLDERTADLQRLTAEYANYRKRTDRDREAVVTYAKAALATDLLPVIDDIERAAAHGDLSGAFKTVADKLIETLAKAGLTPFGDAGEAFDPSVHEAVAHDTSPNVAGPTVTSVLRRGYRFGDRVVRAALVAVTDYEAGPSAEPGQLDQHDADPVGDEQRSG
jgi:molecular chaperone GrpE